MAETVTPNAVEEQYYRVGCTKFVLLSVFTLGIYDIYWNYKNWKYIKQRDQSRLSPFWRAIFYPFWFYLLLADISEATGRKFFYSEIHRWVLVVSLFLLQIAWRLPNPYWLVTFLAFAPMLPVVSAIARVNDAAGAGVSKSAFHRPIHCLAYLLGGPLVLFSALSSINYFPSTAVIPGEALWDRDVAYLRESELLAPDEEIIYFYSTALLSIKGDGQFISDEFVTSYWRDPSDNELYMAYAAYQDIRDVEVAWGTSVLEDTVVTIVQESGETFELWLSQESGGDKKFVEELQRIWKSVRGEL